MASALLCPSGTFVDEFVGGGGNFRGLVIYHGLTVRKHFTCADGSGTFTIVFHPQFTPATPGDCGEAGPFSVVGGTGAYAQLRGHGDSVSSGTRKTALPRHSRGASGSS